MRRSWVTSRTVPSKASTACSSCSIAGRSRWLVGSSRTSRFTPRCWSNASAARVRSPGESVAQARATCSPPSPNLASRVLASVGSSPAGSAATQNVSSSVSPPLNSERAWSTRPGRTPDPIVARPASGDEAPVSTASRVDLPAPLAPLTRTRSPAPNCTVTGPRTKSPRRTTASVSTATTAPERGAAAISIRSSHSLRGSSTTSSRSNARSDCEILAACFSERCPARLRMCLSRSASLPPVLRIVLRTPLSSQVFCVWTRSLSWSTRPAYSS